MAINKRIGFSVWIRRDDGSDPKSYDAVGPGATGPFIHHTARQSDVMEIVILCTSGKMPVILYSCKGDGAPGCVWYPRTDDDGFTEWTRTDMIAEYSHLFEQAKSPYN